MAMHDLNGKVALVTGGTRGIGLATARAFAAAGATVIVSSRKADAVTAVVGELRTLGHSVHGIPANVGRAGEPEALALAAMQVAGGVDILVNNAATNPVYGPITDATAEIFDKIMAVNVKAPFLLGNLVLPSMRARGGGAVLNISSIGGLAPENGLGVYSVSKAALISLTQVAAKEWGQFNVRVNALCPGFIKTDFSAVLWNNPQAIERMKAEQPIPRLGTPEEVANFALFLCSSAASFCTGGVYLVDGGYLL